MLEDELADESLGGFLPDPQTIISHIATDPDDAVTSLGLQNVFQRSGTLDQLREDGATRALGHLTVHKCAAHTLNLIGSAILDVKKCDDLTGEYQ